ncbi:molybdopterin-containing oxidoreductase family protein [Desulfosoma sp.]|uniref:molybdopterin-containing oxidoreductase family protein n=1 Tax=Desulfosoma sp. TaxID=2603217 RepID=UPI00404AEB3D
MAQEWFRTHCARFDHGGCGLKVSIKDGRLDKVVPDPDDPFSHGWHCRKGLSAKERLESPLRLTQPLRRTGPRGSGLWELVGWDEALDLLAQHFSRAIQTLGPESVAFAQGAPKGPEFFLLLRLANLLRCPNVAGSQHVCHMPREQMALVTCGFFPVADLEGPSRCVLLWGSNPPATNEEGVLGGHLHACLNQGARLVVVDPVRTAVAEKADVWLQIRPGTDDLLAMGFLHVIVEEGWYDREFVEQWTVGFEDLRRAVKAYTPQRVAAGCWVPEEKIRAAARLYAQNRPACLQWGNAVEHTPRSADTCRALVHLMAVTGNLEQPGGNIRADMPRLMPLKDMIALDDFPDRPKKLLNHHHRILPRLISVPSWMVVQSILNQAPYPIRSLYMQGTNPLLSYTDAAVVKKALESLEFLAVADQVMTPTAALADLVLPVALPMEYNDIGHYGLPHGFVTARPKLVDPPEGCRSDLWIINEWAKRMGLGDRFWPKEEDILEAIVAPSGLSFRELCAKGVVFGPKRYRTYEDKGFKTPSGRVELRSSLLEKWGFSALPAAEDPAPLPEDFPFLLTSRKPKDFFHSAYRHLERLRQKHAEPTVWISPDSAARLGISEGQKIFIETAHGRIAQRAHLTEALHHPVILADFGWWFPERTGDPLRGWAASNLNMLTGVGRTDPVMATPQVRAIPCRLTPA